MADRYEYEDDVEEFPDEGFTRDSAVAVEPRSKSQQRQQQQAAEPTYQSTTPKGVRSSLHTGHGLLQLSTTPVTPTRAYSNASTPASSTAPAFPTPNFSMFYQDGHSLVGGMVNTVKLKELYQIRANHALVNVPNVHSALPEKIDLTTVELLTFFPGIIKDPCFVYRALSTGWDSTTLRRVANTNRDWSAFSKDGSAELPRDAWRSPVAKGMAYVLGLKEADFTESKYKSTTVASRPKMSDYTASGLSKMYQTPASNDAPARKWFLSELLNGVKVIPEGPDAGTLSNLLWYHQNDTVEDMEMSQVNEFVMSYGINRISHGAADDEACFRYWEENKPTKRGRKIKYDQKIEFDN